MTFEISGFAIKIIIAVISSGILSSLIYKNWVASNAEARRKRDAEDLQQEQDRRRQAEQKNFNIGICSMNYFPARGESFTTTCMGMRTWV